MVNAFLQGWECPKCGRVYSPSTMMCPYCGNDQTGNYHFGTNAGDGPLVFRSCSTCKHTFGEDFSRCSGCNVWNNYQNWEYFNGGNQS